MSVLDRPDDVLRTPRGVAAEEHARQRALERDAIDDGHVPLAELHADVALDPRERIVLPDREDDDVAWNQYRLERAALRPSALLVPFDAVELHADELAGVEHEPFRRVILDDLDLLLFRVFQLPRRRLEVLPSAPRHHFHVRAAEPLRRAAAVHGRVADADDQHA